MIPFSQKNKFSSRLSAFLMLLAWMAVIFSFSTMSGKETVDPPPLWYFLERKGAHVFEYALLLIFSFRYFSLIFFRESLVRILFLSAGFSFMYGVSDELHQFFVPLRGAYFSDVLIDCIGILFATVMIFLFQKNKNRSR